MFALLQIVIYITLAEYRGNHKTWNSVMAADLLDRKWNENLYLKNKVNLRVVPSDAYVYRRPISMGALNLC